MRRIAILFAVHSMGCVGLTELSAGYESGLTNSERGGVVAVRVAGAEKGDALLDFTLVRGRVSSESGRVGLLGLGATPYARLSESVVWRGTVGLLLLDFSTRDRAGFGMFSPYLETGFTFEVGRHALLSLLAGVEYEIRFVGENDGLYGYLALGLGYGRL